MRRSDEGEQQGRRGTAIAVYNDRIRRADGLLKASFVANFPFLLISLVLYSASPALKEAVRPFDGPVLVFSLFTAMPFAGLTAFAVLRLHALGAWRRNTANLPTQAPVRDRRRMLLDRVDRFGAGLIVLQLLLLMYHQLVPTEVRLHLAEVRDLLTAIVPVLLAAWLVVRLRRRRAAS